MRDVAGRVAVVTGGASGIGQGMARAFGAAGMRVVLADRRPDALDAAVAELTAAGHEAVGVVTDVSRRVDVEALAEATMQAFGAVHVLCNNAGVGLLGTIEQSRLEDWEFTLGVDLFGPIYGVKTFLPLIGAQDWGHINATASIAGLLAAQAAGPYNVAKHGVVALMATLERELRSARSPVRASVLCPGPINTEIASHSVEARRARGDSPGAMTGGDGAGERTRGDAVGASLQSALSRGMHPDEVGRLVLDAIRTDRFWIFTHPKLLGHVTQQVEAMVADGSLSRVRLLG